MNHQNSLESLQAEYRRAWHNFTTEMDSLQSLDNSLRSGEVARAEAAAAKYREARNALAEYMLAQDIHSADVELPEDAESLSSDLRRSQAA